MQRLNARYQRAPAAGAGGGFSWHDGLLIHQLDVRDGQFGWWALPSSPSSSPSSAASAASSSATHDVATHPVLSSSFVSRHMPPDPPLSRLSRQGDGGQPLRPMPIFSLNTGGLVLSPEHATLLCSYSQDSASLKRTCTASSGGADSADHAHANASASASSTAGCIPGCCGKNAVQQGQPIWCSSRWLPKPPSATASSSSSGGGAGELDGGADDTCAWPPANFSDMMADWVALRAAHAHRHEWTTEWYSQAALEPILPGQSSRPLSRP